MHLLGIPCHQFMVPWPQTWPLLVLWSPYPRNGSHPRIPTCNQPIMTFCTIWQTHCHQLLLSAPLSLSWCYANYHQPIKKEQSPDHKSPLPVPMSMPHIIPPNDSHDTVNNPVMAPSHNIWYNFCSWPTNIINHINNIHNTQLHHTPPTLSDFVGAITDVATRKSLKYRDLIKCNNYHGLQIDSFAKNLAAFNKGTNNLWHKLHLLCQQIPNSNNCKVTYGWIVMSYRPQKANPHHTQLTVGGDKVDYPWDASTATAEITT